LNPPGTAIQPIVLLGEKSGGAAVSAPNAGQSVMPEQSTKDIKENLAIVSPPVAPYAVRARLKVRLADRGIRIDAKQYRESRPFNASHEALPRLIPITC
jgi:hypothetical protein